MLQVHTALAEGEDGANVSLCNDIALVSLATKDTAPSDVVSGLLTAEDQGKQSYQ